MAASSMSPPNFKNELGGAGAGISYGAPASPSNQSPLPHDHNNSSLGLLKNLADKRFRGDGQPTKRRGPKPDSRPAMTRRQELNRQAQRTHRERKELYIKALEDEVLRLKEIYANVSQDKERLADENRSLKVVLKQNGLPIPGASAVTDDNTSSPLAGPYLGSNSSASINGSGSYGPASSSTQNTAYTPPPGSAMSTTTAVQGTSPRNGLSPSQNATGLQQHSPTTLPNLPKRNSGFDYEQAGIDFVLSLERPCMDHIPWLLERANAEGGQEPNGHSLMASCPPEPFANLTPDIPFGPKRESQTAAPSNNSDAGQPSSGGAIPTTSRDLSRIGALPRPRAAYGACPLPKPRRTGTDGDDAGAQPKTWELSKADLATLLDLSQKLNLEGEITPVMAWGMVLGHPRLGELNAEDFAKLTDELNTKVRCYGFGAVMEEFEVRDALEAIFSTKPEPLVSGAS